jgi:beta-N-acetylhexosaminidase
MLSGWWVQKTPLLAPQAPSMVPSLVKKAPAPAAAWADSVLATMTLDQKIGQFFMIAAYSNKNEGHYQYISNLIVNQHLGGVIFFQGDPVSQAVLTNRYQKIAKVPLFVAIDGEYGLAMRLDNTMSFPRQITLGAVQDNKLIEQLGQVMGQQCRRLGIHINFAPVVDINTNPNNPVIGHRAFGDQPDNVAEKGVALTRGMQRQRVLACAKHFIGHGDTEKDSHFGMPTISYGPERLQNVELYPFKRLIADSVSSILVGHLHVPFYDNKVATLSDKIVTNLLKNELGYRGLVFTDALNMRGVSNGMSAGEVNVQAFLAGNDILLHAENIADGIRRIKEAVSLNQISESEINSRVVKILKAKYWAGLSRPTDVEVNGIVADLNDARGQFLKKKIGENAVTVVKNQYDLLPIRHLDLKRFVSVGIDTRLGNSFQQMLDRYASFQHFTTENKNDEQLFQEMLAQADSSKVFVVGIHALKSSPARRYGVSWAAQEFVKKLAQKSQVVVCVFGNPYALKYFADVPHLLCGYEDTPEFQEATAQILFGALPALGKVPVTIENLCPAGTGLVLPAMGRLSFGQPEHLGQTSDKWAELDALAQSAMVNRVFPGCQVVVAKQGRIVWNKNYGKLSYDVAENVREQTLYDLASVTKVAATLQALMFLYDQKALDLNQKASFYLPILKNTNKEQITIRDLLMHQAGLVAYLPFWEKTRNESGLKPEFFVATPSSDFPFPVAEGIFARQDIRDSVMHWIVKTPLINRREADGRYAYVYSDFGLIILGQIAEKLLNQPLDAFLQQNFYEPLGMKSTGFNPLKRGISQYQIAPTENDRVFRDRDLRGTVQDQNAALQGGVSGHAGLFSSALDLAKIGQMNLQRGSYGQQRFLSSETLALFTKDQAGRNHRGLGWDRRPNDGESTYISERASAQAFGHSGYTGTMLWMDPQHDLVIVMLSNRVHPSAQNNKINVLKIRRKMMTAIYRAIE